MSRNIENESLLMTALYSLLAVFLMALGTLPVVAHFAAVFIYLPQFHHFVREELDPIWRYHIADSSVTVGLAYYLIVLFLLWQSRWVGWRASYYFFNRVLDYFCDSPLHKFNRGGVGQSDGAAVEEIAVEGCGVKIKQANNSFGDN